MNSEIMNIVTDTMEFLNCKLQQFYDIDGNITIFTIIS